MTSSRNLYRFKFNDEVPLLEAECLLLVAMIAVENIYSRAQVRLNARFGLDHMRRVIEVDGSTDLGRALASAYASLLIKGFGEEEFRVEHAEPQTCSKSARQFSESAGR